MAHRNTSRVILLMLVAALVVGIVLGSALMLLPTPPVSPTPTAPYPLDRPEGRPRMLE